MIIAPHSHRVSRPWRNGGGVTHEIAVGRAAAGEGFSWRVSLATIDRDGVFSEFPGVDRHLMPLSEGGLRLDVEGISETIPRHSVISFPGEVTVTAIDVQRPGTDLNVMVDRAFGCASLISAAVSGRIDVSTRPDETAIVVALEGSLTCGDDRLDRSDAVVLGDGEAVALSGSGLVAIARIVPRAPDD